MRQSDSGEDRPDGCREGQERYEHPESAREASRARAGARGARPFKHACAYKISRSKCKKASTCRAKKFAGAGKFDARGQKMWLCEHREK